MAAWVPTMQIVTVYPFWKIPIEKMAWNVEQQSLTVKSNVFLTNAYKIYANMNAHTPTHMYIHTH